MTVLDAARAIAEELGQTTLVARIDAVAAGRSRSAVPPPTPDDAAFTLRLEGEHWTVSHRGRSIVLRDSRGLKVLAQLVGNPGVELHVAQLVTADACTGEATADTGDAGALLDRETISAYRRRLLDVREQLEEAESFSDAGRALRLREEIEGLTRELARGVGLGGRERRAGVAAERARTTVQKRLRSAIARIEEGLPELGRHLERTIRTGTFCGYFPDGPTRRRP
jgi:hypothetical protein